MSSLRAAPITLLLLLAGAAPAHAADGEATRLNLGEGAQAAAQPGASGGTLVRTIAGLAIVLAVIYGLTWVLKQVKRSREAAQSGTGLSTLATLPLGPNRSLHLVRAGEEVVLLGAGEGGVTVVRTYGAREAQALGLVEDAPAPSPAVVGTLAAQHAAEPAASRGLVDALRRRTVIR
jgi:flagellar protein FliO/FliZ